jgi:hypothetical protein
MDALVSASGTVERRAKRPWISALLYLFLPLSFFVVARLFHGGIVETQYISSMIEAFETNAMPELAQDYLTSKPALSLDQQTRKAEEEVEVPHEPLNIVLFYADDWTSKIVGKLNPLVNTPNIDEMADNGMMFTQNCVTTSVCWISRASLMTGVYSARHRQTEPWKTVRRDKIDRLQSVYIFSSCAL